MSAQKVSVVAVLLVAGCLCLSNHSKAATIGHWRFEDTPGFLLDSSGNGNHLSVTGTVTQATLPGTGPGSSFPTIVPQTLQTNIKAADFEGTSDSLQRTTISSVPTTQFTIESFVHWADSANSNESFADGIFGLRNGSTPGFFFQIRTDGNSGSDPDGELFLTVNNGTTNFTIPSGFAPTPATDYYMAVAFDLNSTANFYVKDLTANGPLQSFIINHSATGTSLNATAATIEIGGFLGASGSFDFDGLMDEIRLSNVVLDVSELLITEFQVIPIPEPGSFYLLGAGMLFMRRKFRRG